MSLIVMSMLCLKHKHVLCLNTMSKFAEYQFHKQCLVLAAICRAVSLSSIDQGKHWLFHSNLLNHMCVCMCVGGGREREREQVSEEVRDNRSLEAVV